MARVLITNAASGDVPGHEILREPYEDGVTDPQQWLRDVAQQWRAAYSLDTDLLRAVILRFTARPSAGALDIRETMERRLTTGGTRLVLVVPSSELTWTRAAIDARPSRIRTYATTPAQLTAWIDAHAWPTPGNPALGGNHQRIGRGPWAPWSVCVDDPAPPPQFPPDPRTV